MIYQSCEFMVDCNLAKGQYLLTYHRRICIP